MLIVAIEAGLSLKTRSTKSRRRFTNSLSDPLDAVEYSSFKTLSANSDPVSLEDNVLPLSA
jgi:hypothetical protein